MIKKLSIALVAILTLGSCAREFNKVYRTTDTDFKYEYAKECYVQGKYSNAVTLLQDLVTIQKGTDNGQECLFMLAMAEYQLKDYEAASETFKKYYQTYPQGGLCGDRLLLYRSKPLPVHSRGTTGPDTDRGCHRCLPKLPRPLSQRKVEIDGRATDV